MFIFYKEKKTENKYFAKKKDFFFNYKVENNYANYKECFVIKTKTYLLLK
jgi:hypothetical protein